MRYAARELVILPALLSLLRIPLAVCFPWVVHKPVLAFCVLALAGFSDVLDGWVARRYGLVTATGAALDPVTDKIFVLTVAITLILTGQLSPGAVLLLSVREIGELPLVLWFALSASARAARAKHPCANIPGKLATCLQFAAVGWVLLNRPGVEVWLALAALGGAVAAISYWKRALETVQLLRRDHPA